MSNSALAAGVRHLRGMANEQRRRDESDEQLLHAFTARHDESAFATLVRRHGPMVLHVCRRVLGHHQDAEDAFQATFLVLTRRAAALRKKAALAGFLHGTAYRMALAARRAAARRRKHEGRVPARPGENPSGELLWREVQALLDEEIARLPQAYREVFVLCCLESVSRAEAARQLGLKEGTVSSRLATARQRLSRRLARRGVELTALLAATALGMPPVSALPAELLLKSMRATAPPAVAALAAHSLGGIGKIKLAAALLLAVSVLGGAVCGFALGRKQPATPPAPAAGGPAARADDRPQAAPPRTEAAKVLEIRGRVLDPEGKPRAGAKLLLLRERDNVEPLGVSGADGRFTVAVPKGVKDPYLLAQSEGTGFDFLKLASSRPGKPAELRLVKDNPIRGRLVNTEGQPIPGVRVTAWEVETYLNNSLDSFTAAWMNLFVARGSGLGTSKQLWTGAGALFAATTDADGRFTLRGVGAERTARLHFRGGGIADAEAWVVNRAGFDPRPYNDANMKRDRDGRRSVNWRWWILSGPDFSLVAPAEKVVRGVVTDADTGKPRPGAEVLLTSYDGEPLQDAPKAKTDAAGRYEIHGARKARKYLVVATNDPEAGYVTSQVWAEDTAGYQPVAANLKVKKGVIVTGRLIDGTTGEALPAFVMTAVLRGNPFVKDYPPFAPLFMAQCHSFARVEAGKSFRLVTLPGPILLMGKDESWPWVPYKWAGADPKYPQYFTKDGGGFYGHNLMAPLQGHCKVLDIEPGVAEVKQDIVLERQKALTVLHVQDAEGRPVAGAWAKASGDEFWVTYHGLRESSSCPVYGEASDRPQRMVVYQPERKLAGTLVLKGDEKPPLVVKLGPAATVEGRLLDAEGKQLAGMVVDVRYRDDAAKEVHARLHEGQQIVTDARGAFRFGEVLPEWKFELSFRRGTRIFEREARPAETEVEIKPGECHDLGAIQVKPAREKSGE